jgi:thiamine-phosphate pyrophosphorylase
MPMVSRRASQRPAPRAASPVDLAALAVRGGADGVHTEAGPAEARALRERLKDRIVGAGNIRSRHDAMEFGEAGVDYVMFGEPRPDGSVPHLDAVIERAAWWAEIFETPCVAYAPSLAAVSDLVRTGAEFIGLGEAVWSNSDGPQAAIEVARSTPETAG